ncbi:MAG: hypothetical protein WC061_11105, partial [Melioribacteraceae bacterium]
MIFKNKIAFLFLVAMSAGSILLLHFPGSTPIIIYTTVYIFSSIIFLLLSVYIFNLEFSKRQVYLIIFCSLLLRISFISSPVAGSDDIYRYMWDGKIQTNGINPYLYAPEDPHLNSFHSDLLPEALNFKEMKTIYFPLSQWLFYLGYQLSGESVWGYKLLLFLFELMTLTAIILLTKKIKINPKFSLLYALSPLPIFQFAIDAHLDGFGLPLLLFSIYFYLSEKKIFSAVLLGLSLSIKPVGLLLIPVFFLNEKTISGKLKIVLIPLLAFFLQFVFYISATNPFEAFFIFTKNWYFNGFIFNLLNSMFSNNQTSRLICAIFLIISLIPLYFSKKALSDKIYFAVLLLMIFSPVVHQWYIAWVLILLPVVRKPSGIYFAALSSLTAVTIMNYQLYGVWQDYRIIL